MKKSTLFFMMVLVTGAGYAQDVATQAAYWIRYQENIIFSSKIHWNTEVDNRRFFDPDVALQFIAHSRVHYRLDRWDFGGGLTYSIVFAQKPEEGYDQGTSEIRPVAEVSYEMPLGKILMNNRLRVDDRYIQSDPEKSVFEESTNVIRLRYRLLFRIPLTYDDNQQPKLALRLADEIMVNNWKNIFDQNRIYVTVDFPVSKKVSIETGYIYIYQQRFGEEEFFERHVLRFSLLHRIYVK